MTHPIPVACLYRVSTKKQVEENDIPMQKNACRAFIETMPGWALAKEYYEKGVSGYHMSADRRDVLQQARTDAQNGIFAVLLVFMFDRLGRREDETPFIVEWFVGQGIAVWSVKEGEQRFENRADKLINYIRFWQSGGESEKTSLRVKEKHKQMVEDGLYRGGAPPYGYDLKDSEHKNPKGYRLKELVINAKESEVVQRIFRLTCEKGYGGARIAQYLNERGIKTKLGNHWTAVSVLGLMKNPLYKGYYVSGKRPSTRGESKRVPPEQWIWSDRLPHLVIVEDRLWDTAEAVRTSRTAKNGQFPLQTRGRLLLTGTARCGTCGAKMGSVFAVKKWFRKSDNTETRYLQPKYICHGRRSDIPCTGQRSFSQKKVDPVIMETVCAYMDVLPKANLASQIANVQDKRLQNIEADLEEIKTQTAKTEKALSLLNDEIVKTLTNESSFTGAQLSVLITKKEAEHKELQRSEKILEKQLEKARSTHRPEADAEQGPCITTTHWRTELESAEPEIRRMVVSHLIESVFLSGEGVAVHFTCDLFDLAVYDV